MRVMGGLVVAKGQVTLLGSPAMNPTRTHIVTAKQGVIRTHRALVPFWKVWLACFVAAGTYGIAWGGIMALIIGGAVFGAVTVDVLWSSLLAVLAFILLAILSVFIVPLITKALVRSIARARVGLAWTCVAVLVGWVVVSALSTLLWLIPGAQPFAALLVWAGSTALTAWLIEKRSTPLTPTPAVVPASSYADAASLPHQH